MSTKPRPNAAEQAKASIREAIGKVTGDPEIHAADTTYKAEAEVRPGTGGKAECLPRRACK
jgi:uncharacterized protein YjbJ (UPF0337 family)